MTIEFEAQPEIETPKKSKEKSSKNLKEFSLLKNEVEKSKMPDRKKVALLNKLVSLHADKKIDKDEVELLKIILVKERNKGIISSANTDILNKIEVADCPDKCYVKTPDAPNVLKLKKDTVCNYKFDADNERYIIYVPIIIPSEAQLSMNAAHRLVRGLEIDAKDLPPEKLLYNRLNLKPHEFEKYFGYDDEIAIGNKVKEENEYKF